MLSFTHLLFMYMEAEEDAARRRRHFFLQYYRPSPLSYVDKFYVLDEPFSLEGMADYECEQQFRFKKADIPRLRDALGLQEMVRLDNRAIVDSIEAVCMLLRRLSFPNRLSDLVPIFRRPESTISRTVHHLLDHIISNFRHALSLDHSCTAERLDRYCKALVDAGCPLDRCFGFIDGTLVPTCRPGDNQEVAYNGHKRVHGLKFQSVTTPDGLLRDFHGPYEGQRHDAAILNESGLLDRLQAICDTHGRYFIYGDPAYPVTPLIMVGYKGNRITRQQEEFNRAMSRIRISVEWGFSILKRKWAFIDYEKDLMIWLNCPGKLIMVAAILTNCHNCLYGNQLSVVFQVSPPSLEEYLTLR